MRILIADDQTLFREMLKSLLAQEQDMTIVASVSNGREAMEECASQTVDIALLDIRMPEIDGVNTAHQLLKVSPQTRVILLTAFEEAEMVAGAVHENIFGFILKDIKSDLLVQVVRMVNYGLYISEKSIHDFWINYMRDCPVPAAQQNDTISKMTEFTPTDIQILQCLTTGMSNREIAEKISYSESTVKNRISKLLNDLDLKDRTQLALFALKHRLT